MSAESSYISAEGDNIRQTVTMIEDLLGRKSLSQYEIIALGKLLQDVYTGVGRILRTLLEQQGVKTSRTESWHKELLLAARQRELVTESQFEALRNLMLLRHMQVHGYGFMLDQQRLVELAKPVSKLCYDFLKSIGGSQEH